MQANPPFSRLWPLLYASLFLGMAIYFIHSFPLVADLEMSDDSIYMTRYIGPYMALHEQMWAPLYSAYFFVFSLFAPNRVELADWATMLLLIFPGFMGFWFLVSRKVHGGLALVICLLGTFAMANSQIWPRINHLLVAFISMAFLLAGDPEKPINYSRKLAAALSPTLLIRPEMTLPILFFIFQGFRNRKSAFENRNLPPFLDHLITWIPFVFLAISIPNHFFQSRESLAFVQHYALTKQKSGATSINNPMLNASLIFRQDFAQDSGFLKAFAQNPFAVLRHLLINLLFLFSQIWTWLPDLLAGQQFVGESWGFIKVLWVVFLAVFIFLCWNKFENKKLETNLLSSSLKRELKTLSLIGLPFLMASLVYHPRGHYLVPLFWLLIFALGIFLKSFLSERTTSLLALVFILFFLVKAPTFSFPYVKKEGAQKRKTLQLLESTGKRSGGFVGTGEHFEAYLKGEFNEVNTRFPETMKLKEYIQLKNIELILVNRGFRTRSKLDPRWNSILQNPGLFGFKKWGKPGLEDSVLVRVSVIKP
jgi:hypothetical protein